MIVGPTITERPGDGAERTNPLRDLGDVLEALDRLPLPLFAVTSNGVIRWVNRAAENVVGDVRGVRFTQVVAPESKAVTESALASKVVGALASTDYDAVVLAEDGARVDVEISSVPIAGTTGVTGVFGAVRIKDGATPGPPVTARSLTPRQAEVLGYLARGLQTEEMAAEMGRSRETVRNHVRALLQRLGAHSRLEAVTTARRRGLL